MQRRSLAPALLALLLASAAPAHAEEAEGQRVLKIIDEAIHRDKSVVEPVKETAFLTRGMPSFEMSEPSRADRQVKASKKDRQSFFFQLDDKLKDKVAASRKHVGGVYHRSAKYSHTSWHNTAILYPETSKVDTTPRIEHEVVANAPVGSKVSVVVGKEKLDMPRLMMIVGAGVQRHNSRSYSSLPKLRDDVQVHTVTVTRRDKRLSANEVHLRATETRRLFVPSKGVARLHRQRRVARLQAHIPARK